jgi:hypothetical protein
MMSDKAILANVEVIMVNRKWSIGTDKSDIAREQSQQQFYDEEAEETLASSEIRTTTNKSPMIWKYKNFYLFPSLLVGLSAVSDLLGLET